ncbi:MAG: hypothetical protein AB8B93_01895 [Pseudomonadales bacterium]
MKFSQVLKNPALALVIAIPLLSVAVGGTMLYLAIKTDNRSPSAAPFEEEPPLSKTSWRGADAP